MFDTVLNTHNLTMLDENARKTYYDIEQLSSLWFRCFLINSKEITENNVCKFSIANYYLYRRICPIQLLIRLKQASNGIGMIRKLEM